MAATVAAASHSSFRTRFRCFKRPPTEPWCACAVPNSPLTRGAHTRQGQPRPGERAAPEIEHADRRRRTTALLVVPFRVWRSAAKKPKAIFTAIKHSHPDDHSDSTRSDAPQNGLGPEIPVDDPPEYFKMYSGKYDKIMQCVWGQSKGQLPE